MGDPYTASFSRQTINTDVYLANQQDASLYTNIEILKLHRQVVFLTILGIGSLVVYIAAKVMRINEDYKDLIAFVNGARSNVKGGWSRSSGLSIALSDAWPWYNSFFGPSHNPIFPECIRLAYYNTTFRCLACSMGAGVFIEQVWEKCEAHLNDPTMDAKSIICSVLGSQGNSVCEQECPKPTSYAPSALFSTATGAFSGAAGGAGIGLALHGSALAAAGPYALIAGMGIGIASALYSRSQQQKADVARCKNMTGQCYLPPGVSCDSV